MLIAGIICLCAGVAMLVPLLNIMEEARASIFHAFAGDRVMAFLAIAVTLIITGIVLTILGVVKSKNRAAYNSMVNKEKNMLQKAQCPKCGINLSDSATACPRCGEIIIRQEK